jgi:hypothetical protein
MANLLPVLQQPGQLQPAAAHQTFCAFYQDETLDPCQRNYVQIMERFDPEVNPGISHIFLLDQAVGSGPIPQAYLCCAQRQAQTKIYCVHLPSRYTGSLDGRVTPWDSTSFAFLGEVVQGQITTVVLPDLAFRTFNVRAKSVDYIVTHLNELGAHGLPPADANDPDATGLTTRAIMYLPARYVPLLLSPTGYTIRQVWDILYPAIIDANELGVCNALLKWLRAVTMGVMIANVLGPASTAIELTVPIADESLIMHQSRILKAVLPGLYQPAASLELAITQMAAAVTQNTNDTRLAREEKAAQRNEPKLPSDRFTVTLNILQEYLQVADETHLPPLWHRWANCTKRQEFNVLTEVLHAYARGPDAFSSCAPIASSKLVQDLLSFIFVSESTDDIKTGIQPFIIADASAEHRQANLELARMYGMLSAGEHSLLLTDLETLQAKEVQSIPLSYFELERNLGMFGNLLGAVLGSTHILTTKYREFWTLLATSYRQEIQQIIDSKRYIKPAHILWSIQLICYTWFSQ